jgi:hypothetical protein
MRAAPESKPINSFQLGEWDVLSISFVQNLSVFHELIEKGDWGRIEVCGTVSYT